ncbi:MAG TPA: LuxR C-terminal-related transcriptional regulator [Acidimicrobiales bacterium]|nr:LuxR C-terminal-related transcriptional regulator [Acidimicrobiales bacterium]
MPAPAVLARLRVAEVQRSLDAAPVALVLMDAEGTIVAANMAAAAFVGARDAAEIIGLPLVRFGAEDVRDLAGHRLRDVTLGIVEGYVSPSRVERLDGTVEPAHVWACQVTLEEGPMVVMGIVPEATLDDTALAGALAPGQFAVLTTDHDWCVAGESSDAERLLDLRREELTGHGVLGLVHPLDVGKASLAFTSLGHDGTTVTVGARLRGRNGWHDVLLTMTRLCGHDPPRVACLLTSRWAPRLAPGPGTPEPVVRVLADATGLRQADAVRPLVLERSGALHALTPRQGEIVARLIQGQSVADIARGMYVSASTVRNQLAHVYRRFGVHSQAALVSALYAGPT